MVGLGIAIFAHNQMYADRVNPPTLDFSKPLFFITIALLAFYFAGMILNDAKDVNVDRTNRPDRPIPLGVIKQKDAWVAGISLLVVGLLLCTLVSTHALLWGSLLILSICLYTICHHAWFVPSLVLMGACRGLVYMVAFSAIAQTFSFTAVMFAIGVSLYTLILTWLGKNEHINNKKRALMVWLIALPPLVPIQFFMQHLELNLLLYFVFLGWIGLASKAFASEQTGRGMHLILAAFCLLDCLYLSILGELSLLVVSFLCFVLTLGIQRFVKGT